MRLETTSASPSITRAVSALAGHHEAGDAVDLMAVQLHARRGCLRGAGHASDRARSPRAPGAREIGLWYRPRRLAPAVALAGVALTAVGGLRCLGRSSW